MALHQEVREVFRDVFEQPNLEISAETNASNVEGWDSFMHVNLIVALEERFNVNFTTKEISEMACVGDLFVLLEDKGVK